MVFLSYLMVNFLEFLSYEVEIIFWESEAKYKKTVYQNLVIGIFLESPFEASLSSRTNIAGVWK